MSELKLTDSKSHMKSYPGYKDSGVSWLGEIPNHWKVKRLKYITAINPSKSELEAVNRKIHVSFLPMELIGFGNLSLEQDRVLEDVYQGFTYFRDNDVLIAKITPSFENGKGAIARNLTNAIGFGTTELHILRPNKLSCSDYLYYLSMSHAFRTIGAIFMHGTAGQKRVEDYFIINFQSPLPPQSEQHTIASFLDLQTAKIDTLIAKKQRLIELLHEKRTALISQAVAKGLDPNVSLIDSGEEWLGKIPSHWKVKRLKYVAQLESGHTPDRNIPEYWENCTIPWVTLNDVGFLKDNDYISETTNLINEQGLAHSSARVLPKGTVILSRDASVGMCGIITVPMATSQHYVDWICGNELLNKYLIYIFRVPMQYEFKKLIMGATIPTIGMPEVKKFVVPLPPYAEQESIVKYVEQETCRIDSLIEKVQAAIQSLQEYRTSLISAAVTGKIDIYNKPEEG